MSTLDPNVNNISIKSNWATTAATVGMTIYSLFQIFGAFAKYLPYNAILRNGDNKPRRRKIKALIQTSVACENGA